MKLTRCGVFDVRHPQRETAFKLSVTMNHGLYAVRGFEASEKPPANGRHWILTASVRNWIGELEEIQP